MGTKIPFLLQLAREAKEIVRDHYPVYQGSGEFIGEKGKGTRID
jgi:hypothetical protein